MNEIFQVRLKNVIDMAVTFTAMNRVFEKQSKHQIVSRLGVALGELGTVSDRVDFEKIHSAFCNWFVTQIRTAESRKNGRVTKLARAASYGHAAKVFDVASKVYVYYCHLPNVKAAAALLPLLHGAIDTEILKNLKSRYPEPGINAETISEIGEREYAVLQGLVARHIGDEFKDQGIYPAQYDDIMWYRLNR